MDNNFYNYFNCNNKEELYNLIKNQDKSVKELIDYIEYSKENILERNYKITNQDQLEEAFRMGDIINPGADEISIIFFDSANNIVNNKVFNQETSLEDIMLESYSAVARSFMLMNGKNATKRTLELTNDLSSLGFTEIDILTKEKGNTFYSKLAYSSKDFGVPKKREASYNFSKEVNKLEKMENYQEFLKFYTNNEIIGKNILYQSKEIGELLKIANQKLTQEEFMVLQHDKNFNVISCESIFRGGLDRSTVDIKTLIPKILDKRVAGISISHNHPSGNSNPSRADIELTNAIEKMCKKFNKNLLDHYVVSSSKVFSFLNEGLIDDRYLKNIKDIDDKNILTEIIKRDWSKLKYVNPELIEKNIALKAVSENAFAFSYIPEKLQNDREIVLTTIRNKGSLFDSIDSQYYQDKEIIFEAIKSEPFYFPKLSKKIEVDSEIALFAVKQEASNYLFLDEKYKKDKEVIKNVLKNGNNLVLFDAKNRNNTEIVEIAVKNNPESIKYASKELQEHFQLKNLLKERIEKGISRGNYNCFSGNEIIMPNHKSNDKRWVRVDDVEKNNIKVKENEKPMLTVLTGKNEKGNLKLTTVEFYNVSQLQITKEIEQKFVPIKQKEQEKTVEKSKDKGVGIGY